MTPLLFLALAGAGGVGAACRMLVDGLIRGWVRVAYPLGTTVINVSGSLLLGVLTGLALGNVLPEAWVIVVGTGFCGGYTTFSTASFETVRLLQDGRRLVAVANGFGTLVLSVAAAMLGLWLGTLA
ncbi:fluoride efflux transporter CrcB [Microbacterium sp. STN6]|uniref:fluoride efflux transporter CrcB n=1 Tax=Microbacterium sp. STN6 TaxID=2995588 RepID=UPI002260D0AB|nr:fluoride efflux transporter CrcB [Microbacterium sp. STN6]MCX7520879.1 fluoride efflux transporter CrcB [Microbacterium sp. STN6]